MRCIATRRMRGRNRPCTHPAVVAYIVDGEPYAFCQRHRTQERQRFAERYSVPVKVLA
jgi:hypothetical protein